MASTKGGASRADKAIANLFAEPPLNPGELAARLRGLDHTACRRALLDRLQRGEVTLHDRGIFLDAARRVGLRSEAQRLAELVVDGSRGRHARAIAMEVVGEAGDRALASVHSRLSQEEILDLGDVFLEDLLAGAQADEGDSEQIAEMLAVAPEDARLFLLQRLGACRRRIGTSALQAYRCALARKALRPLWAPMLAGMLEEADEQTVQALDALVAAQKDPAARAELQETLLRVRTQLADPAHTRPAPAGRAWVGAMDGQAAFVVLASFENPNGSRTLADVCLRACEEVRDGFVLPLIDEAKVESILAQTRGAGVLLVETNLLQAAALVRAAARKPSPTRLPGEVRAAVSAFLRVPDAELDAPVPGALPSPEQMHALLSGPELLGSWFFDLGDFGAARVEPPSAPGTPDDAWFRHAARQIATSPLRQRVQGMADHMARWYSWSGDATRSGQMSALASEAARDFEGCRLLRAMIENSLLGASAQPPDDDDIFRAETRTLLRSALFAHVEKPRGRDVAGLDFAAAAADLLDAFFALAPLTVRPSGQLQSQMAAEVGRLFVDHLLAAGSPKMSKFAKRAAQVVTRHGVEPQLARKLADGLVVGLGQFAKHCCGECPVSCLDTPEDRMSDVFFSDDHPVLGRPSR